MINDQGTCDNAPERFQPCKPGFSAVTLGYDVLSMPIVGWLWNGAHWTAAVVSDGNVIAFNELYEARNNKWHVVADRRQ
jgi:hypothetical protein